MKKRYEDEKRKHVVKRNRKIARDAKSWAGMTYRLQKKKTSKGGNYGI